LVGAIRLVSLSAASTDRAGYLRTIVGFAAAASWAAFEIANVSHTFQPSGRFSAANSL